MNIFSATNRYGFVSWIALGFPVLVLVICGAASRHAIAATTGQQELQQFLQGFDRAAVSLLNSNGDSLVAFNQDQPMVPASAVKLLTGLMAIERWGDSYQASTDFYFDQSTSALTVVGNGDPFLVSEEIQLLARELQAALRANGSAHIKAIHVDNSRFKNTSGLSWQSATSNPYDAVPSALAANFNTLNISVENGRPVSNEEQTPLTRFAWLWAAQQPGVSQSEEKDPLAGLPLLNPLSASIGRINTGSDVALAARYFGELLATFLWQHGTVFIDRTGASSQRSDDLNQPIPMVLLADSVIVESSASGNGRESTDAAATTTTYGELIYTHRNSRPLNSVVAGMLKYSTNFIANNLALMLASDKNGKPAGFDEFRQMAEAYALERFAWKDAVLQEGAGLSLTNRLSAEQLVQLSNAYKSRQDLLPVYKESVFGSTVLAKTGSLKGVSTLAGIIRGKSTTDYTFAILLQDDSIGDSRARDQVLQLLINYIESF